MLCVKCIVVPTKLEKMRAELASLNPCAVQSVSVSRAAVNLCWYYILYSLYIIKDT